MNSELVLTREQVRAVDRLAIERYGMSGLVLMENAGRGAAEILVTPLFGQPVVVCCGRGNNGGDGFVIARHLDNRHIPVRIALFCDPATLTGDATANCEITRRAGVPIEVFTVFDAPRLAEMFAGACCVVDALLGTGSQGEPRPPYDAVIDAINERRTSVAAIDVPSGLDCDTGLAARNTVRATHTITFVAPKPGLLAPAAREFVGQLHVVDIGVPRKLIDEITASP